MKKEKPPRRRKIKRNLLKSPQGPIDPGAAERIFGPPLPTRPTPASSVGRPFTAEEVAGMEQSYEDFLKLRRQRVEENIGRDTISEEPFNRDE